MNELKIEAKSERGSRRWHIYMAMGDRYQVANAPTLREGLQECARNLGISAERIVREGLKDGQSELSGPAERMVNNG